MHYERSPLAKGGAKGLCVAGGLIIAFFNPPADTPADTLPLLQEGQASHSDSFSKYDAFYSKFSSGKY